MQARRVELLIRIATKMCFLKYSNESVATGTFSGGRSARRVPGDACLLPPNANSATPQRIAGHRVPGIIFKGHSFAVHPAARQPESPAGGATSAKHATGCFTIMAILLSLKLHDVHAMKM
jgi:hypothetical protein